MWRFLNRWHTEAAILSIAAFLIPVFAMPLPRFLAVLFTILGAVLLVRSRLDMGWVRAMGRGQIALIAGFLAWAALSIAWSSAPRSVAAFTAARIAVVCFGGLVVIAAVRRLDEDGRRRVARALAAGVTLALAMLLVIYGFERSGLQADRQVSFDLARHFDRGATVAAVLLWPALLALFRQNRGRHAIALLALALLAVGITYSMAAKVALLAGAAAGTATWILPRTAPRTAGALMLGLFLAMPLAGSALPPPDVTSQWHGMTSSIHHRLTIWSFASGLIGQKPLIGYGLESARTVGGKTEITVTIAGSPVIEGVLPLHPHSASLQVYLELGAVGAVLVALFLATAFVRIARECHDRAACAAMMAMLTTSFAVAMVSYGAWQTWWLCALWFMTAMGIAVSRAPK